MKLAKLRRYWCLGLLFLVSCGPGQPVAVPDRDRIMQVSVVSGLMVGRYDGVISIPEVLRLGDFGVGTLDHLDGELIVLDGRAHQVRGDGAVVEVGRERSTPFAVVTLFDSDGEFACPQVGSLKDIDAHLDDRLGQKNNFVAIRVDGRFASLTLRSVHRQEPPYRPLAEVAKSQSVWTHTDLDGTLVGVRCPSWVGSLNVPGYHWHFISNDRKVGGHVLDCKVRGGRVQYDVCGDWLVKLERSAEFNGADLGQDQSEALRRVESSRGEGNVPAGRDGAKP